MDFVLLVLSVAVLVAVISFIVSAYKLNVASKKLRVAARQEGIDIPSSIRSTRLVEIVKGNLSSEVQRNLVPDLEGRIRTSIINFRVVVGLLLIGLFVLWISRN